MFTAMTTSVSSGRNLSNSAAPAETAQSKTRLNAQRPERRGRNMEHDSFQVGEGHCCRRKRGSTPFDVTPRVPSGFHPAGSRRERVLSLPGKLDPSGRASLLYPADDAL